MLAGAGDGKGPGGLQALVGTLVFRRVHLDGRQVLEAVVDQRRQAVHPLAGGRRDGQEGQALPFNIVFELLHLFRGGDVALVAQHDLGTLGQLGAEARQLMVDLLKVRLGVAALAAGHIHHVQQQPAALHMAQEVMAQAQRLRRRPQ